MIKENKYFLINSLEWWWAERVILNIINSEKEKFNIYLITLKSRNFFDIPSWINHICLSTIKNNFLLIIFVPFFIFKLKKIFKKFNLKNWISYLEISNFIHILSKKDAIISFRTNIWVFKWFTWLIYKTLIRYLYPKAKMILVNSEENKYHLWDYLNLDSCKIKVVLNKIDFELINKLKIERLDIQLMKKIKNKKVFITVGRLIWPNDIWSKNHHLLIKWLEETYRNKDKNFIFLIVWDWPERNNLEKQVKSSWLEDNIIFLWQQKNVFKYLNVSDCFVYASDNEWFPNVLLEAKVMWVPIITSDFKTWAREVILWKFDKNLKIEEYPYHWENWILLDFNDYVKWFSQACKI